MRLMPCILCHSIFDTICLSIFLIIITLASSGKNEVRATDMYLLNKLENGLGDVAGLPLVTINLGMITRAVSHKNKNKTLPYGQLFTLIFD